ncbi:MAG: tetratricopeptide repeat protein [Streptosporangiales bacterium]|nr:tetratricopeptide repeat protein [Streptosporangiales bacterium]
MPDADLDAAMRLRAAGDLPAAIEVLSAVIDAEGPDEAEAWFWLAATRHDTGDAATAVAAYRAAIDTGLDADLHVQAHLWLASALLDEHRGEDAREVLDAIWERVEADTSAGDLWQRLYGRTRRATWRLTVAPGRYLTKLELVTGGVGLLCALSTFLPWVSVRSWIDSAPQLLNLWQVAWPNALPMSTSALVVPCYAVQLLDRTAFGWRCALVNVGFAVITAIGASRTAAWIALSGSIPPSAGVPRVTPYAGAIVGWLLTAALLVAAALTLRRAYIVRKASHHAAGCIQQSNER